MATGCGRFPFVRSDRLMASLRSKARAYIFPATTLEVPALWSTEAGEK